MEVSAFQYLNNSTIELKILLIASTSINSVCMQDFTMETFAGPVFASLRGSLGMTEREYQQSLCSENYYLQFISNSKSKADFFLTWVTHTNTHTNTIASRIQMSNSLVWTEALTFKGQLILRWQIHIVLLPVVLFIHLNSFSVSCRNRFPLPSL